ncbi:CHC2 zinc finger domain-containing protein [uncultured Chitinophaga sp.]|uniref:CHC2 zinc finger domain-containing protein n=1 Tax=uncultured Chitinophaga sp. TaxID=339340 RepID=UPI00260E9045|nr:CHC2 zinc finger domain-containing protein [uncultured Chitinophaga sp.]
MEIRDIKQQLSILEVVAHYGLKPDKYNRLLCPFHADKTPSLQLYPKTDTFCCFSTACSAGSGDQLQFIQLMEKGGKHEAIMKAKSMLGAAGAIPAILPSVQLPAGSDADILEQEALMVKVFSYFKRSLPLAKKAVSYLESRSINYQLHEIGYNSGGLHVESKNHHMVSSMVKYGLLKLRSTGGYNVWAKDCVVFPLKNREHKIISLYGRSISNNEDQRHFYLTGRSGLYPCYPEGATTRLILTESVIDAASLLQQAEITTEYGVLALYGTNGLTDEHQQAIINCSGLEEIIFMLDGDSAGQTAITKHAGTLARLLPQVKITAVRLPDGEDINSLLQTHDDNRILIDMISQRQPVIFYSSIEKEAPPVESAVTPATAVDTRLNTATPELLTYDGGLLQITILGGIKLTGLDRLRVTLKVEHTQKQLLPVRHNLDLYNNSHSEQLISKLSEAFEMSLQVVTGIISQLTGALEAYRASRLESMQARPAVKPELTVAQREAAINYLKQPGLLRRTSDDIGRSGIVGETINRLIAYLVYSSRKREAPLHIMFLGASGSGKTYLQERVSELIPVEDKIEITQVTENAFYYFKQEELKHKLLLIEDLDGAESSLYPLRELQSKRRISKTVTLKDSKGNLKTVTVTVEGPVSVSGCTTREKLYEDNANRCLLLYVDGTSDQDRRIMEYQTRLSAGLVDHSQEQTVKELFRSIQQVLQPVRVVNPYAAYIQLPQQIFKPRRTMTLLLSFIETVTFYHQYQREIKRDGSGQPYIESTPEDISAAFGLLKEVLFSKGDELAKATRNFLEQLKEYLSASGQDSFTPQQIRKDFRLHPRSLQRYIRELFQYGYIRQVSGYKHRKGFEYTIADKDEYSQLTKLIDEQLQGILTKISATASTTTVLRQ